MPPDARTTLAGLAAQGSEQTDVLLISMPFGPLNQPSIGLGLLKASLAPLGVSCKVLYMTLAFAEHIGPEIYTEISNGRPLTHDLVGEWIFSGALFPDIEHDVEGYLDNVVRRETSQGEAIRLASEEYIAQVLAVRAQAAEFLDACVDTVLSYRPKMVGFTSIFQQQVASLALARRLKQRAPEIFTVMGGANCEGIMGAEVVRQFPFMDATVSGEGDIIFPQLVERVLARRSLADLQGVNTRASADLAIMTGRASNAPSVRDMDALPYPDYDDFFAQKTDANIDTRFPIRILYETSRGCWWGEKNHCTFCGLNGSTMTYRSKTADRAMAELVHLASGHPDSPISVVDNILDMKYFKDFIPSLIAKEMNLDLFYEVKANLRKEQVQMMRQAGITGIQPGIESLSDSVLKLMRKGVKAVQNIQLLKWCKELGVRSYWNVLWGFPGESPEDYAEVARLLPYLTHFDPPMASATIRLDRFSPNFDQSAEAGFANVQPYPAYSYVYRVPPEAVANLAYYFTFGYHQPQDVASYTAPVAREITAWKKHHDESGLFFVDKGSYLLIWDLRANLPHRLITLTGVQRALYLACDQASTTRALEQIYLEHSGEPAAPGQIDELLQPLCDQHVMLRGGGGLYLGLAVPLGSYTPSKAVLENLQALITQIGTASSGATTIRLGAPAPSPEMVEA
ncbi:RiPP maturation radical SAM protein 1 [Chloroflexia bacterium SDU3-3]|nr:RiPP maturation radical SAM protein 1 [Chloroflexia bacterium SDU3-3]